MAAGGTWQTYRAVDYQFKVRAHSSVEALVHSFLRPFRQEADGDETVATYDLVRDAEDSERYSLFIGGEEIVSRVRLSGPLDRLLWEVSQAATEAAGNRLAIHAGVVALDGQAMLLPAPPGSGKTTLVSGLVRAGCTYLSDELAQIDPSTAQVLPFPRALALSPESVQLLEGLAGRLPPELGERASDKRHVRPDDVRPGSIAVGPSPVGVIVFPSYARDSVTKLEPIRRAEAVVSLIANSFNFGRLGAPALELLGRLVSGAVVFRLTLGDLDEAVGVTMSLLQSGAQAG